MDVKFTKRKFNQNGDLQKKKKKQVVMFAHYLITRQDGVTMSKPDNVIVIWDNAAMGKTQITVFKATLQKLCNILLFWRK